MKRTLLILILGIGMAGVYAQQTDTAKTDTGTKKKRIGIYIGDRDITYNKKDSLKKVSKASDFSFKFTMERIDFGLIKLHDNGSFTLSPANSFLDYDGWKSRHFGFDVLEFSYRFNRYFKVYLSGGLDWNHLRLEDNITILRNQPVLAYSTDAVNYKKNRFSSSYLRIPWSFELNTKADNKGNKFKLVFGPEVGFLINGRVKQKSKENGKQKFDDDYHFSQYRYGGFARIGYGGIGLYFKYFDSDMFENSPPQKGLKNISFGITNSF